jgi:Domain of unknown function (DUF5069)
LQKERGGLKQSTTNEKIMPLNTPDLTQFPPRSPRVRLGGYVILPRCLDKGRATLAGKNGEYHYACPLDQRFLEFVGIDPEALKKELATGKGDGEIRGTARADRCGNARLSQRTDFQSRAQTRRHRGIFRLARFGRLRQFRRQGVKFFRQNKRNFQNQIFDSVHPVNSI